MMDLDGLDLKVMAGISQLEQECGKGEDAAPQVKLIIKWVPVRYLFIYGINAPVWMPNLMCHSVYDQHTC